ncbi:unnamed protein product [Hymenolepis diminuta]|uniref:DUF5733 domain-containing protein n=1 Tax=Hymenolepis diminuta TaxID=6216 RepID=A0A0R3S9R2_HYMDI|nr:unnamed protein product [Hymenolepis diminuta]VUZ45818.1 unnamed protein product [Hymenolepis diminuta]
MTEDREKDPKREKSKEGKHKDKNSKKNKLLPTGQITVAECTLRKIIKQKKVGRYTEEEAKRIYDSVKVKKSGFPAYTASIYSNMVQFAPKKRGKKIQPIGYEDIKQIVMIPGDDDSFLLYVPKTKKTKQFSGIFTWTDPEGEKKLKDALREYHNPVDSESSTDRRKAVQGTTPERDYPLMQRKAGSGPSEVHFDERLLSESFVISTPPPGAHGSSETEIVDSGPIRETYTLYTPKRYINRRSCNYSTSSSSDDNDYNQGGVDDDSYEDESDEEDYEYICRDPNSIFYGERMSPKSQYVDKLLRATAQMKNKYE